MKQQVLKLIETMGAKHFSRKLKNTINLWQWVEQQTTDLPLTTSISERTWCALNGERAPCSFQNTRKFLDISRGYGFCGKTGVCACAKQSVASNVSKTKLAYTDIQKKQIQSQREQTNLQIYGVKNVGQTAEAKQAHADFYADKTQVQAVVDQVAATMQRQHGVKNALLLPSVQHIRINNNPMKNPQTVAQSVATRKRTWDSEKILKENYLRIAQQLEQTYQVKFITPIIHYRGVTQKTYYDFSCVVCAHEFKTWLNNGHRPICKVCNPTPESFVSREEKELFEYVNSLVSGSYQSDRSIINPFQLDIVVPSAKLAIEYGGLYWHSENSSGKAKNYHRKKMLACNAAGYRLITVFSDEWKLQPHKVKNVLAHVLGQTSQSYNARSCELITLTKSEEKAFFDQHHLQNHVPSDVCYALKKQRQNPVCYELWWQ